MKKEVGIAQTPKPSSSRSIGAHNADEPHRSGDGDNGGCYLRDGSPTPFASEASKFL